MTTKILKKIIKSQKGAMDKVLITLILVIISVSAMIGLQNWVEDQENILKSKSENLLDDAQN